LHLLLHIAKVGSEALRRSVNARDAAGMSPLFTALSAGALHVAALLLAAGADMDAADNRGVKPRDMLRISDENRQKRKEEIRQERISDFSVAAALSHVEEIEGGSELVRCFKDMISCQVEPL
jgi:hypothetical protein